MALIDGILAYWNLNNDGSGNVSLVDSTGNGNTLTNNNVALGAGIIGNGGQWPTPYTAGEWLENDSINISSGAVSYSFWVYPSPFSDQSFYVPICLGNASRVAPVINPDGSIQILLNGDFISTDLSVNFSAWNNIVVVLDGSGNCVTYLNGVAGNSASYSFDNLQNIYLGCANDQASVGGSYILEGNLDEVGLWTRALSQTEITELYNNGVGNTYPFSTFYYNNSQSDGDWGNLLNWWQDSSFTVQATALPTSTNPVNIYGQVSQNTQGSNQCFCSSANFWSANFGAGLTLQSTGVVNMQGSSIMAGSTTDSVSMHDSSQLASTSVIDGNVTMRDSSRAFGSILGNATIYYDGGNGQFPIGGTVVGTVTYLNWPAVSPQWFNDQATGGANDGDFNNQANWWTNNTYTIRPINAEGYQQLPDASTDVFIAPVCAISQNSGTSNPTIKSLTANGSNLLYIPITISNGATFSNVGEVFQATIYGNVTFETGAYANQAVINGTATFTSASSLENTWSNNNSIGNLNEGSSWGFTGFNVNISGGGGGGGTALGTNWISRLLHLPWFINV